jgi:hypothetical protein
MPEVTHTQLHTAIAVLQSQATARDIQISEIRTDIKHIGDDVSGIKESMHTLFEHRESVHSDITAIKKAVENIQATENQRIGRDGVWAAILRSPLAAFIAVVGTVIASIFAWAGGKQ